MSWIKKGLHVLAYFARDEKAEPLERWFALLI